MFDLHIEPTVGQQRRETWPRRRRRRKQRRRKPRRRSRSSGITALTDQSWDTSRRARFAIAKLILPRLSVVQSDLKKSKLDQRW